MSTGEGTPPVDTERLRRLSVAMAARQAPDAVVLLHAAADELDASRALVESLSTEVAELRADRERLVERLRDTGDDCAVDDEHYCDTHGMHACPVNEPVRSALAAAPAAPSPQGPTPACPCYPDPRDHEPPCPHASPQGPQRVNRVTESGVERCELCCTPPHPNLESHPYVPEVTP